MRTFLVIAAVAVGVANAALYNLLGDGPLDEVFYLHPDPWPLSVLHALSAIMAGLLVAGLFLRFARRELHGSFFARYGLMVLAVSAGGATLNILLSIVATFFDDRSFIPGGPSETLFYVALSAIPGGILGAIEGVVLAFPLAIILGLFEARTP